jgi:hypothetical protein
MRKLDIVEGDGTFFYPHMAEGGTGHPGLKFSGGITFINDGQSLISLTIRRIKKFEGVFDIMNALAQKHIAIIVASFIEKILCLFRISRTSSILFRFVQRLLDIEDPLVGIILGPGEKNSPVF